MKWNNWYIIIGIVIWSFLDKSVITLKTSYVYGAIIGAIIYFGSDYLTKEKLKSKTVMVENLHTTFDKIDFSIAGYDIIRMGGSSEPWNISGSEGTLILSQEN